MPLHTVVVVPCYNEAQRLDTNAFRAYRVAAPHTVFLFVNDGSTDTTGEMLDALVRDLGAGCAVLHLQQNVGKAEAVRRGLVAALTDPPVLVGFWDADLATPLDAIASFQEVLAQRAGIEMVFGARVAMLGRQIQRNAMRHYTGRMFATAVSLTLDLPIYDSQCGAKLFRVTPSLASLMAEPFLARWIFDVEIIARRIRQSRLTSAAPARQVIYELPLDRWTDVPGSKLRILDFARACIDLLRLRLTYLV